MSNKITEETFESLDSLWVDSNHALRWSSPFVLPVWLKSWWQVFGKETELYLGAVREGDRILGIAPLMIKDNSAFIIGGDDVCDYLDFIVAPGMETDFFDILLDDLKQKGIKQLDLKSLRPDSTVLTSLVSIARNRRYKVLCRQEDVTLELDLPDSWDKYLGFLNTKQRHEVRRKLRRLAEAGEVDYYFIDYGATVNNIMDTFLRMFSASREDKAAFLTSQRESFFRLLADTMAEAGLLKLGVLTLDSIPVSMIICFDYNDCIYLYNSGYDTRHNSLSVGLLSKVLCIKESIEEGKKRFDFLKGDETYKYQLGGREVPLQSCQIIIE